MPRSRRNPKRQRRAPAPTAKPAWRGRLVVLTAVLAVAALVVWTLQPGTERVDVEVPELSRQAAAGAAAFAGNCASCHGDEAAGSERGPPLVHAYYEPGHHGDAAFYAAVKRGVRQHHWRFGDMPAQPQVSDAEIAAIIRYVRELQQANGIFGASG